MPRSVDRSGSPFYVPQDVADEVLQDIEVRAKARKELRRQTFNPDLGTTAQEAEETLAGIRNSVDRYGEYVFGLAPAPVHQFWNRAVDDIIQRRIPQNKILILAPPNSAKSTWNSLIRPCHYLGNKPDHNLLFMTSSDDMAKTFGGSVRMTLQEAERHAEVFPDVRCRPHRTRGWSGDGLYLRGTPVGSKDPAYKAVGFGMSVMGARANGIILDDVLDQKQAESEIEQRKAVDYYTKTVVPRLNTQSGWLLAVMTRFAQGDLGGHFIKLAEQSGDWLILRTPMEAEPDDPMGRRPGESLWPEQFPATFIEATKKSMSIAEYDLVYQADPTGVAGDIFTNERYFKDLPPNFWQEVYPRCFTAQAVDLAFSKNKRTAFTVILTYAVDEQFNIYLLHIDRARYQVRDSEERLKELIRLTHPLVTVIETENFHDATIRSMVIRIMSEMMCDIRLDKPETDKVARARLPAGRAEHGFMYVDRDAPWYRTFMSELLGFPNSTFKDQVDALSLAAVTVQRMEEQKLRLRSVSTPQQARTVMSA